MIRNGLFMVAVGCMAFATVGCQTMSPAAEQAQEMGGSADFNHEAAAKEGRLLAERVAAHPLDSTAELEGYQQQAEATEPEADVDAIAVVIPEPEPAPETQPAAGVLTPCGVRVIETSEFAVGDPCLTTEDFMRQLNLSDEQMARVGELSDSVGQQAH